MQLLIFYIFIVVCVLVAGCVHAGRMRNELRTAILFRHLGLIVRQNMPMPMALQFAAAGETGVTRRLLTRTSHLLQAGLPLSEALRRAYPICPGLPLSILRTAERAGTLPSVLAEINERGVGRPRQTSGGQLRWGYVGVTAIVFPVIFFLFSYYVFPRFHTIYMDIDTTPPLITTEVFAANPFTTATPTTWYGQAFGAFLVTLALLPAAVATWAVTRLVPRRADRLRRTQIAADYVRWHIWPFRQIARAESCAESIPSIRLATAAGWPLADAIDQAAELDVNWVWRTRLRGWAECVRHGAAAPEAGRACGVPEMLRRAIAVGVRDGDLDAPLHHAASYYGFLARRWRTLAGQLAWLVAMLVMAAAVGLFCVAFFAALSKLITNAIAQIG